MSDLVGELFPYAVAVALSPVPLIIVFLVLRSPGGRWAGVAFAATRLIVVAGIAVIVSLAAELLPESVASPFASALRIALGVGLMIWAITKILRPKGDPELPRWMVSLERTSIAGAARVGALVSAVNPKEIAFGVGAGLTIAAADRGIGEIVVAASLYAVIACLAIIAVVAAVWIAQERVAVPLDHAYHWLVRNYAVVVGAVLLIIGAILVGEGISALAAPAGE